MAAWRIRIFSSWSPHLLSRRPSGPRTCWGNRGRHWSCVSSSASTVINNLTLLISEGFSMNESILTVRLRKEFACWSTRNRSEYHILLPRRSFEDWTHRTWNWNENQTRNSITPPSLCARLFEHVSLGLVIDIATSHSPLCNPERGLPTDTLLLQPLIVVWNQDILNYPRNYPKIQKLFMGR